MAEGEIRERYGVGALPIWEPQVPLVRLETARPFARTFGVLNGDPRSVSRRKESVLDVLRQSKKRQNLTGSSLSRIRRGLAKAWRLMLTLQIDEASGAIDQIELQLDDVSAEAARRYCAATRLM